MHQIKFKPTGLWKLDGNLLDLSGYGAQATVTGTPSEYFSLHPDTAHSITLDSLNYVVFDSPVFKVGHEDKPFSIEVVVLPHQLLAGESQIIGHDGLGDGIVINDDEVSFVTKYKNSGEVRASHHIQFAQKLHIVGTHTSTNNSLYINGELVGEAPVLSEQISDEYIDNSESLTLGGGNKISASMVALYPSALTITKVIELYEVLDDMYDREPVEFFAGDVINTSNELFAPSIVQSFSIEEDWDNGRLYKASIIGDLVMPSENEEGSVAGTWLYPVDLYEEGEPITIRAGTVRWTGTGFKVYTSIDGNNWSHIPNAGYIPEFVGGFDPTDATLLLLVEFDDGLANAYMSSLDINIFTVEDVPDEGQQPLVVAGDAYPTSNHDPLAFHDNSGTVLNGGSLSIGVQDDPDQVGEDPLSDYSTVEVWFKKVDSAGPTFDPLPSTTYINSDPSGTLGEHEWGLYHLVYNTPITSFTVSGNGTISSMAVYPAALSQSDITYINENYVSVHKIEVYESGLMDFIEPEEPVSIYTNSWGVVTSSAD